MTGKTERPRDSTLAQLGAALRWPPDWLDYIRRGETPPDVVVRNPDGTTTLRVAVWVPAGGEVRMRLLPGLVGIA